MSCVAGQFAEFFVGVSCAKVCQVVDLKAVTVSPLCRVGLVSNLAQLHIVYLLLRFTRGAKSTTCWKAWANMKLKEWLKEELTNITRNDVIALTAVSAILVFVALLNSVDLKWSEIELGDVQLHLPHGVNVTITNSLVYVTAKEEYVLTTANDQVIYPFYVLYDGEKVIAFYNTTTPFVVHTRSAVCYIEDTYTCLIVQDRNTPSFFNPAPSS